MQAKLEAHSAKLWSLNEIERTGGEPDVVGQDKKTANTFFMIAQQKAPQAAETFVMTLKRWSPGKLTNWKTAPWVWPMPWALSF